MPAEQLAFDIFAADNASGTFTDVGNAAAGAGLKMTAAAKAAGSLQDAISAQGRAASIATGANAALAASNTALAASAGGLSTAYLRNLAGLKATQAALAASTSDLRNNYAGWGILRTQVSLFGGALSGVPFLAGVAGWHILTDAVIEFAAVVIPATVALGTFGLAAAGDVGDIVTQMKNLNTVSTATGRNLYPMSGELSAIQDAVRPEVYQLFGDALTIINNRAGTFNKLAVGTGTVLDQLGARLSVAINSGGMQTFLSHAVSDVAQIGNVIGNLFGTIGNLLKTMPGYAQILLGIVDTTSKGLEAVTGNSVVQGIVRAGLTMHGAFLYAGLGATIMAAGIRGGLTQVGNFAERIGGALLSTDRFGEAGLTAGRGLLGFAGAAADAAAIPWGWVAIVAAGIGILAYKLLTAKDATQQWYAAQQQVLQQAPAVSGYTLLMEDQVQANEKLATAQHQLANAGQEWEKVGSAQTGYMRVQNAAWAAANANVQENKAGIQNLTDQSNLYNYRLNTLGKTYGGVNIAQGLLVASGVKMGQMLTYGTNAFNMIKQQVQATVDAYHAMGQQGGILGADMAVMNKLAGDQYTAMQQLNGAWDTYTGNLSKLAGGQVAVEQDLKTLTSNAKAAGASFTGTNKASLTLQSTLFQTLQPAIQGVIDQMRNANAPTKQLAQVISTDLKPSVDEGALANIAWKNTVYDMAKEAGYDGPNKIKPLTNWIDGNATSMQKATGTANQLTTAWTKLGGTWDKIKNSLITVVMKGQGDFNIQGVSSTILHGITAAGASGAGHSTGWRVPGFGGGDKHPAMLEGGEAVVPKHLVGAVAPFLAANRVPGFAAGGRVSSSYSGLAIPMVPWAGTMAPDFLSSMTSIMENNITAGVKAAQAALTSGLGGAPPGSGPYQAYARKLFPRFGWGMSQWPPFNAIVMQESGWNPRAQNPTSTAYGIGQFLDSTWATVGATKTSNPYAQIWDMEKYIKQRYGDPAAAEAYHLRNNSYDVGGWLPRGVSLAVNRTGYPEQVIPGGPNHGRHGPTVIRIIGSGSPTAYDTFLLNEIQRLARNAGGGDVQVAFGTKT